MAPKDSANVAKTEEARKKFEAQKEKYDKLRGDVAIKLKFLDENRVCILWYLKIEHFNPFPNKPVFLCVCSTNLLQTLWEKEKLLVMSNFSFSYSVFYPFEELSGILIELQSLGKGLLSTEELNSLYNSPCPMD